MTLRFAAGQDIADLDANPLADTAPTGTDDSTWEVDNTAPTVTIAGVPPASTAPFTATFTFSEAVEGFAVGDITVGNGAASAFSGSGAVPGAHHARTGRRITPAPVGTAPVTVDVATPARLQRTGPATPAGRRRGRHRPSSPSPATTGARAPRSTARR